VKAGTFQKRECLTRLLRDAEAVHPDHMHGRVDAAFARALQIQDDGILASLIRHEIPIISAVFVPDSLDGALDGRSLVEEDVIGHRRRFRRQCGRGCRDAPRSVVRMHQRA
jgi:hypothetical protein